MTEIFTKIYNELWGTDTSLLIWTLFGFLVIVFISRRIGKLRELKNREKLLLTIDTILFPIMIVLFHFISSAISPESNVYAISVSLALLCTTWFLNRFLKLYYWSKKFVEQSGGKAPKLLQNFVALISYILIISFILGFIFRRLSKMLTNIAVVEFYHIKF